MCGFITGGGGGGGGGGGSGGGIGIGGLVKGTDDLTGGAEGLIIEPGGLPIGGGGLYDPGGRYIPGLEGVFCNLESWGGRWSGICGSDPKSFIF